MAAPTKYCRFKLCVASSLVLNPYTAWHTVDFEAFKTVDDVVQNLCTQLGLPPGVVALYLQNVIIPNNEICAHVFRDDDEIELRDITSEMHTRILPGNKRKYKDVEDESCIDNSPIKGKKRKKREKRKQASSFGGDRNIGEGWDTSTILPYASECGQLGTSSTLPAEGVVADIASATSSQKEKASVFTTKDSQVTKDSQSLDGDVKIEKQKKKKRDRSLNFTPIEQQLIAEIETMPKPKRHRKHKRKGSRKAVNSVCREGSEERVKEKKAPVILNSSYHGMKKVFASDDDITVEADVAADRSPQASAEVIKGDCFSSIEVFPLQHEAKALFVENGDSLKKDVLDVTISAPSILPESGREKHEQCSATKQQSVRNRSNQAGPVVFKREQMKLRATISPAILETLKCESLKESMATSRNVEHSDSMLSPVTVNPATSSTPKPRPEKRIKWHQNMLANTTPKSSAVGNESRPNDEQRNISTIYRCDSKEAAREEPADESEDEPTPVHAAKDYTVYPMLDGPPRIGDNLAFKRLEVSEEYSPVVSDYKQGIVINYEPKSKLVHIKLTGEIKHPKRSGIFDVHIEEEGETLTNVDSAHDQIVDTLPSLIEPRLIS